MSSTAESPRRLQLLSATLPMCVQLSYAHALRSGMLRTAPCHDAAVEHGWAAPRQFQEAAFEGCPSRDWGPLFYKVALTRSQRVSGAAIPAPR
eukprot:354267-Chlamydomonas_euryale.AAC.2